MEGIKPLKSETVANSKKSKRIGLDNYKRNMEMKERVAKENSDLLIIKITGERDSYGNYKDLTCFQYLSNPNGLIDPSNSFDGARSKLDPNAPLVAFDPAEQKVALKKSLLTDEHRKYIKAIDEKLKPKPKTK